MEGVDGLRKVPLVSMIWLLLVLVGCSNNLEGYSGKVEAEETLRTYTKAFANQDASVIYELYGGSYEWLESFLRGFLPEIDLADKKGIINNYVKQGIMPRISLNEILEQKEVNEDEYVFVVNFINEDGTPFITREADTIRDKEFTYTLKRVDGKFKVMELPPYQP